MARVCSSIFSTECVLQGAAAGAVATIVVGFNWGGWSLGSAADKMAKERFHESTFESAICFASASGSARNWATHTGASAVTTASSERRDEFPKEFVTFPVNRTRIPPLWTRATRCCLHRSQPRSNEIIATELKFLHRFSVGCWHAQQAATLPSRRREGL